MRANYATRFFVGKGSGGDDPFHGVVEDHGVVAVVEAPLQFLEVAVHMLDAHLVEGPDDRTLEQRPHALNAVGVDIADYPPLVGMADRLVAGIVVGNAEVGFQLIGVDRLRLHL